MLDNFEVMGNGFEVKVINVIPVSLPTWAKFFGDRENDPNNWWYTEVHAWAQVEYTIHDSSVSTGLFGYCNEIVENDDDSKVSGIMELADVCSTFGYYTTKKPEYMDDRDVKKYNN